MTTGRPSVFFTDTSELGNPVLRDALSLLARHPARTFDLVGTAEAADVVLYLEHGYVGLAELPRLLRRVRQRPTARHFMFSESDWPFPVLPGAYPSLATPRAWARSWAYVPVNRAADAIAGTPSGGRGADLLFSFLGRVTTHPIRQHIIRLDTPETPCVDIADASARFEGFDYRQTYAELIQRSQFVLCPRGFGASSIRIFEAMSLGRVPVIVSDRWQRPPDVAWDDCCVMVSQRDVLQIPALLAPLQSQAEAMGQRCKQAYDTCFAPEVFFDRLLEMLLTTMAGHGSTPAVIVARAAASTGAREVRTVGHQLRSRMKTGTP